jgi:hypothetical protein
MENALLVAFFKRDILCERCPGKKNKKQMQYFANIHLCAVYHLEFRARGRAVLLNFTEI